MENSLHSTINQPQMISEQIPVKVDYEWGILKEVVVGIPHFRIPNELPDHLGNFSADAGLTFLKKHKGKTIKEADIVLHESMTNQMNNAIKILEDRGIKVHRPEILTEPEMKYLEQQEPLGGIQIFPRDSMLVIGNHFIETEPLSPLRRRERFGIRRVLADRLAHSNAKIISMPPAIPTNGDLKNLKPSPLLEGGDVFLLGKDIYVGVSGNASNNEGIDWLQQYLGTDYNVHKVALSPKFLHLDCCLATPREGLAIICREGFIDGLPEFLHGWELIELPFNQAKELLGCNGLILDNRTIMIHTALPELAKKLEKAGQTVITTPFDAIYTFSGAFRCWHHPLIRE